VRDDEQRNRSELVGDWLVAGRLRLEHPRHLPDGVATAKRRNVSDRNDIVGVRPVLGVVHSILAVATSSGYRVLARHGLSERADDDEILSTSRASTAFGLSGVGGSGVQLELEVSVHSRPDWHCGGKDGPYKVSPAGGVVPIWGYSRGMASAERLGHGVSDSPACGDRDGAAVFDTKGRRTMRTGLSHICLVVAALPVAAFVVCLVWAVMVRYGLIG